MSERFVLIDQKLVPWPQVAQARRARAAAIRSQLQAPMVIRDKLDDVINPCNGRPYDSKSAYYKAVKQAGCVIVGNEAEEMVKSPPYTSSPITSREVADAAAKVEAGYKPAVSETDRLNDW